MSTSAHFHDRLQAAAGDHSYRQLGEMTDTHPETVRRYMQGQAPSAAFITNLCRANGISGEWLLSGRGPMRVKDIKSHALKHADPNELMGAVAHVLTQLIERVDRLERLVHNVETRLNVVGGAPPRMDTNHESATLTKDDDESNGNSTRRSHGSRADGVSRRIARALSERSSETDADGS